MNILFLLIALSLALGLLAISAFCWAVFDGQYQEKSFEPHLSLESAEEGKFS